MECAFCLLLIDDDSFFCDMCGEGVKVCLYCKKTGKGKNCTSCGRPLVLAGVQQTDSSLVGTQNINGSVGISQALGQSEFISTATMHVAVENQTPTNAPILRLINNNINVDIKIEDDDIIGRTSGRHVSIFGKFKQVSGRHCKFNYDKSQGWTISDLGSTYKTSCNNQELSPNRPQSLSDQTLLKIASSGVISSDTGKPLQSIEFLVRIIPT